MPTGERRFLHIPSVSSSKQRRTKFLTTAKPYGILSGMEGVNLNWPGTSELIPGCKPKSEKCAKHLLENARLADERLRESPIHKIKGFLPTPSVSS